LVSCSHKPIRGIHWTKWLDYIETNELDPRKVPAVLLASFYRDRWNGYKSSAALAWNNSVKVAPELAQGELGTDLIQKYIRYFTERSSELASLYVMIRSNGGIRFENYSFSSIIIQVRHCLFMPAIFRLQTLLPFATLESKGYIECPFLINTSFQMQRFIEQFIGENIPDLASSANNEIAFESQAFGLETALRTSAFESYLPF